MKPRIGLILLALTGFAATPAAAKSYRAERYDASIRVLPGGHLEVTETVDFRFDGTFERVFRDIPTRRTDEIEILRASMDGREMPFGEGRGRVEVSHKSRVRVLWRFSPVTDAAHTFTVTYRVNGVGYPTRDGDFVQWRALPNEHDYSIAHSTVEVRYPSALVREPQVLTRRVDDFRIDRGENSIRVASTGISRNGWVDVALTFEPSAVAAVPPAWYARQERAQALAPRWIAAAGVIGLMGLVVLWMLRQAYDAPSRDLARAGDVAAAPDPLPPAIAGALASNGRPSLEHAMAALFGLAERGELEVREEAKGVFGQRNFTLVRRHIAALASKHEQTAVDIAFKDKDRDDPSVPLNRVRSRLTRHFGTFKKAIREEMLQAGLIDRERQHVYRRYGAVSLVMLIVSLLAFGGMAVLVDEYQGWPMLLPAALLAVALIGFIFQAATTPLSNEGVRRRERWRAYQKHLKAVAEQKRHLTTDSPAHVLPFAVSLGLAPAWAKLIQSHPVAAPVWFHAIAAHGDDGAFPAFIGAGGAASGGGSGGAGGGAGGGASGAS
jgi:hypothetical protein